MSPRDAMGWGGLIGLAVCAVGLVATAVVLLIRWALR